MPITKLSPAYLKEFDEKVQEAVKRFPEVVRVRHNFDEDWTGEPAIYFRVVLSDEVGVGKSFSEVARRVEGAITGDLQLYDSEYFPFFYFRGKSEQDRVKEPSWE